VCESRGERERKRERESWMEKERGRGEREENLSSKAEKGTEREGGRERERIVSSYLARWPSGSRCKAYNLHSRKVHFFSLCSSTEKEEK
jgi:hypothetical protein